MAALPSVGASGAMPHMLAGEWGGKALMEWQKRHKHIPSVCQAEG